MSVRMRWFIISIKRNYLLVFFTISLLLFVLAYIYTNESEKSMENHKKYTFVDNKESTTNDDIIITKDVFSNSELRAKMLRSKVEKLNKKFKKSRYLMLNRKNPVKPNYNVHVFYYAWYGNPKHDGRYMHWNHNYLPNWKRGKNEKYPEGRHEPPYDIGSNYYPSLGCYSSRDPMVIGTHLKHLKEIGVGVIVVSWSPPKHQDSPHDLLPMLFDYAAKYSIKIALHIEPYIGRNPINLLEHLKNFYRQFYNHTALFKINKVSLNRSVPVVYVYDSYLTPTAAWRELLSSRGNLSVRNTEFDSVFIGLLVDMQHRYHIKKSQFDGFYTYFATNSFTYGSTWKNWKSLAKFATQNGLIFAPSVGPGYIDTQVRPWNSGNTRLRRHGQYYDVAWRSAINNNVNFVTITSFNEWHEGTQIEPAQPKSSNEFTYLDYEPEGQLFYLNLTKYWIGVFEESQN